MQNLLAVIYGIVFGVANIIPGVSGGTMLVVFGCYDKVCGALTLNFKEIKKNIIFLIFFGVGAVLGLLGFSFVITFLFDNFPVQTYMFFIGLIIGSVPLIIRNATIKEKFSAKCIIPFVIAAAVVIGLSVLESGTGESTELNVISETQGQYSVTFTNTSGNEIQDWEIGIEEGTLVSAEGARIEYIQGTADKIKSMLGMGSEEAAEPNTILPTEGAESLKAGESVSFTVYGEGIVFDTPEYSTSMNIGLLIKLFLVSALAAVAMIIPGVSGSFIMVILGTYVTVITAIKNLEILTLVPVAVGVILGLVAGARIITFLMKRYRLIVFSAILGLVAGSIYAIIPSDFGFNIATLIGAICMAAGFAISFIVGKNTKVEDDI